MPNRNNYWVSPHEDGWQVKREGNQKATSVHTTQAEAWKEAREQAKSQGGEAFLQNKQGRVRARNSYGVDPFPPEG